MILVLIIKLYQIKFKKSSFLTQKNVNFFENNKTNKRKTIKNNYINSNYNNSNSSNNLEYSNNEFIKNKKIKQSYVFSLPKNYNKNMLLKESIKASKSFYSKNSNINKRKNIKFEDYFFLQLLIII